MLRIVLSLPPCIFRINYLAAGGNGQVEVVSIVLFDVETANLLIETNNYFIIDQNVFSMTVSSLSFSLSIKQFKLDLCVCRWAGVCLFSFYWRAIATDKDSIAGRTNANDSFMSNNNRMHRERLISDNCELWASERFATFVQSTRNQWIASSHHKHNDMTNTNLRSSVLRRSSIAKIEFNGRFRFWTQNIN